MCISTSATGPETLSRSAFPPSPGAAGNWASTWPASPFRWCRPRTTPAAAWWWTRNGRTDVPGLYAIGEVSCTGLHGANRLASNSLLECLVFAEVAAQAIRTQLDRPHPQVEAPHWDESQVTDSDEDVVIAHNWEELRRSMWDYVGIVRTDKRLQRAMHRVQLLKQEVQEYYSHYRVGNDLIELRNLIEVADLIIRSALLRRESRGLHFNLDHPEAVDPPKDTILFPGSVEHLDLMRPHLERMAAH